MAMHQLQREGSGYLRVKSAEKGGTEKGMYCVLGAS